MMKKGVGVGWRNNGELFEDRTKDKSSQKVIVVVGLRIMTDDRRRTGAWKAE